MTHLKQISTELSSVYDYERLAKCTMTSDRWAYIFGNAMDGHTSKRNLQKFEQLLLKQRVLGEDLAQGNCKKTILGHSLSMPLLIAPLAFQKLADPLGEIATLKAAHAQNVGFCLSTLASTSIEEVANAEPKSQRWFQLYCQPKIQDTLKLIDRAQRAGFSAIVITIDAPINGVRNDEQKSGFKLPETIRAVNLENGLTKALPGENLFASWMAQAPTWQTIQQIRSHTDLPIILKGIMNPEDAKKSVQFGINGIVVSNHGGRVLDTQPSSIEMLPLIKKQLPQDMILLLDSGVRRGSDIFKAIALGADAVLLGRPVFYGLQVAGAMGVAHILRILRDELEATMALCGCNSIEQINEDCLYFFN